MELGKSWKISAKEHIGPVRRLVFIRFGGVISPVLCIAPAKSEAQKLRINLPMPPTFR